MNFLYTGINDYVFNFEFIQKLEKKYNYRPRIVVGDFFQIERNKFYNSKIKYIDINEAIINKLDIKQDFKLNKNAKNYLLKYYEILFQMFKKYEYSTGNFNKEEKINYILRCASYWNNLIKKKKINFIFFLESPHRVFDFIIYCLAKYYKIPTMWFRDLNLDSGKFIVESQYFKPPILKTNKISKKFKKNENLLKDKLKYEFYISREKKKIFYILIAGLKKLFTNYFSNIQPNPKKFKSEFYMIKIRGFQTLFWHLKNLIKTIHLNLSYIFIAKNEIKNENFVFFPMSYQPEATSYPDSQFLHDQKKIILTISKNLPKNFYLYVKEHPTQLNLTSTHSFNSPQLRKLNFYKEILRETKNVIFLSKSFNVEKCIRKSSLVIVTNGTAGIESLVNLKPIITLGHVWYIFCPGIKVVTSYPMLKKNIILYFKKKLKLKIELEKLNSFMHLVLSNSRRILYKPNHEIIYKKNKTKNRKLKIMKFFSDSIKVLLNQKRF